MVSGTVLNFSLGINSNLVILEISMWHTCGRSSETPRTRVQSAISISKTKQLYIVIIMNTDQNRWIQTRQHQAG